MIITITKVPDKGELQLYGNPLSIGAFFTQSEINSEHFRYVHTGPEPTATPPEDFFEFFAKDSEDPALATGTQTFDIYIENVNDAPVLAINAGLTVDQESAVTAIGAYLLGRRDADNKTADTLT